MYKLKPKKGAVKRFKITKNGSVKCYSAKRRHNLGNRSSRALRQSRGSNYLSKGDANLVKKYFLVG